jgi:hypothetical protein
MVLPAWVGRGRVAVQATDVHGHQQLEPAAGSLTVTK